MTGKQPRSNRRSFARGVLTVAGAGTIAGCAGDSGSTEDGGSSGLEESDTNPAGNGSDTGDSESTEDNSSDPEEGQEEEEQTPQWEKDTRNGIPLNGLGAYTDQMLEAGPVSATTAETINNALEGAETVEEERDALTEILTDENYALLMSEYHRQRGQQEEVENQIVVNQNWSFTSDSEPILEIYKVVNGELHSRPILIDSDPETYNRQVNRPDSGEPEYLAYIRDSTNWTRTVPQDWVAEEDLRNSFEEWTEAEKRSRRESTQRFWSNGLFGIGKEPEIIPYDAESSMVLFDGMYHDGDTQAVVDLNNKYRDSDVFNSENLVSAEYTEGEWMFREHSDKQIGDPLPGEDDFFDLVEGNET